MKISILCSSGTHPVNHWLTNWIIQHRAIHTISLHRNKDELSGGDLLFLISCSELVDVDVRRKYAKVLVIHASDLPKGRGWSPHIWSIINSESEIVVTLLEASDKVDSGDIWLKEKITINPDSLYDEINNMLFDAEINLMTYAVENFQTIIPEPQTITVTPTYYQKRNPKDSEINVNKSIADQFDLLRVCDPERFPAHFRLHGCTYKIVLEKVIDE